MKYGTWFYVTFVQHNKTQTAVEKKKKCHIPIVHNKQQPKRIQNKIFVVGSSYQRGLTASCFYFFFLFTVLHLNCTPLHFSLTDVFFIFFPEIQKKKKEKDPLCTLLSKILSFHQSHDNIKSRSPPFN